MKIKITIYELDSKKRERITECKIFDSRKEAEEFLNSLQPKPKPYPNLGNEKVWYLMSAI